MKLSGLLIAAIGCLSGLVHASTTEARFNAIPRFDNVQGDDLNVRVALYLEQVAQYLDQNLPVTTTNMTNILRDFLAFLVQNVYLGEFRQIYLTHRISWYTLLGPLANSLRPHLGHYSLDHLMLAIQYDPAPFVDFLCLIHGNRGNRLESQVYENCRELVEDYTNLMAAVHIARPPIPIPIPIPMPTETSIRDSGSDSDTGIPFQQDQSPPGPIMSAYAHRARYGPPAEASHHVTGHTSHIVLTSIMTIAVYLLL